MLTKKIKIDSTYKNLKSGLELTIINGLTVITGGNGSGKTNLLEYIKANSPKFGIKKEQVSFLDFQAIVGLMNKNSTYSATPPIDTQTYENAIKYFLDSQVKVGMDLKYHITTVKNAFILESTHDNINENRIIIKDFLEYCETIKSINITNILHDDITKLHFTISEYITSERYLNIIEKPTKLLFINKCLSYFKKNCILAKELYDPVAVQEKLKQIYHFDKSPWEILNQQLSDNGFKNRLLEPNNFDKFELKFITPDGNIISVNELSSGEKIILHLVGFALGSEDIHVKLLLIDEIDAYLNPTMAQMMINILKQFVINKMKINVIMTTHSPITINCLSSNDQVLWMDNGQIEEKSKNEVIQLLTPGMFTFNESNIESIFNISGKECIIFTEGETDIIHIESAMRKLDLKLYNKLLFIECDHGNALSVKDWLIKLSSIKNLDIPVIIGIFDNDNEGNKCYHSLKDNNKFILDINESYAFNKNVFAIKLNANNKNKFNKNYCPVELMYDLDFLAEHNVISIIQQKSKLEAIKNKYINGREIYESIIDDDNPEAYLINENYKRRFATYVENNLSKVDKDIFSGFNNLISTVNQIISSTLSSKT